MRSMENKYESPEVAVVECVVEKGFAASNDYVEINPDAGIPD